MSRQLFQDGQRKYVTRAERDAFLTAAAKAERDARTLCMTLAYSGCRVSEALALTADRVDLTGQMLVIETLKKRQRGVYRAIPIPPILIDALDMVHGIREAQSSRDGGRDRMLWRWSRTTAWRRVCEVMTAAGIDGPQASPKGLRHGYGVAAVEVGIALNMLRKWMGHADMETTAIYADAVGEQEQAIAARMWGG